MNTPRILLVQGANMCFLGRRQPEFYGTTSAAELDAMLLAHAERRGYQLEIFYTNHEGAAIDRLYAAADQGVNGLVMNPAGFNYAGYALRDCVLALPFPYVEVHISNVAKRGIHGVMAAAARGVIYGFGLQSYVLGLDAMLDIVLRDAIAP
jgi:3-dehydroquinate dehydratase-2